MRSLKAIALLTVAFSRLAYYHATQPNDRFDAIEHRASVPFIRERPRQNDNLSSDPDVAPAPHLLQ
jgi:hypothetical protein